MASRWDKGDTKDYINCPMDKDQYLAFVEALLAGEKTEFKEWEASTPYFDGCMPIGDGRARDRELRHGPMKPVGLDNPKTGRWLCRRATAAGQCTGRAVEHGRVPDQAEACGAGTDLPA